MITFTVYGEPTAQGRARFSTQGGHVRAYDPAKSKDYKQYVRIEALKVKPNIPLQGPVSLAVKVYRSIPKSFNKTKRQHAILGRILPITKPDLKNIIAGVEDALKGIIYQDDSQVVDFGDSGKWYSEQPRIEVMVMEVEAGEM